MRSSNRGFTLVELLVVIGIIAVLIGVLVPTLSAARASATDTQCKARLRQLYQAQQIYAGQNRDRMTPVVYPELSSPYASGARSWRDALRETMRVSEEATPDFFECPARPDGSVNTVGLNSAIMMPQWGLRTSKRTDVTRTQFDPRAGKRAEKPFSQLILFADKGTSSDDVLRTSDGYSFINESNSYGVFNLMELWVRHTPQGMLRHKGSRANAVFMDGHVEAVKDELHVHSGHWYFGEEPMAIKVIGATCCQ